MDSSRNLVTWYPLEVYPKTLDTRTVPRREVLAPVPILTQVRWRWMMRKQFQTKTVSKRFSNEVLGLLFSTQVGNVESMTSSELCCHFMDFTTCCHMGYGILMLFCSHCPMMTQRWTSEKLCLSIKLHRAEGKQQDMVMNDYIASLPIEGKLRVFHALVWMA